MAIIIPFNGKTPRIHPSAFIAPTAVLIGDVTIGEDSSVWFGAVLRGDDPTNGIIVGPRTSVQDNCVVHVGAWGPRKSVPTSPSGTGRNSKAARSETGPLSV